MRSGPNASLPSSLFRGSQVLSGSDMAKRRAAASSAEAVEVQAGWRHSLRASRDKTALSCKPFSLVTISQCQWLISCRDCSHNAIQKSV